MAFLSRLCCCLHWNGPTENRRRETIITSFQRCDQRHGKLTERIRFDKCANERAEDTARGIHEKLWSRQRRKIAMLAPEGILRNKKKLKTLNKKSKETSNRRHRHHCNYNILLEWKAQMLERILRIECRHRRVFESHSKTLIIAQFNIPREHNSAAHLKIGREKETNTRERETSVQ